MIVIMIIFVPRVMHNWWGKPYRLVRFLELLLFGKFIRNAQFRVLCFSGTGPTAHIQVRCRWHPWGRFVALRTLDFGLLIHSVTHHINHRARIAHIFVCWHGKIFSESQRPGHCPGHRFHSVVAKVIVFSLCNTVRWFANRVSSRFQAPKTGRVATKNLRFNLVGQLRITITLN